jgi:hypothetical protein
MYPSVMLLGTRFKARNCISEAGPQDPYRNIFSLKASDTEYCKLYNFLSTKNCGTLIKNSHRQGIVWKTDHKLRYMMLN